MKKIVSLAVTAGLIATLLVPFSAGAQTSTTQLLEQIKSLMAQAKTLQDQLASIQQQQQQLNQQTQATVAQLVSTLSQGSQGDEVTQLQTLLALDSSIYPEGIVSGYYGGLTRLAVQRFQRKWGIEDVGFVGPRTRAQLNALWNSHLASSTKLDDDVADDIKDEIGKITLSPLSSDPCAVPGNPLSGSSPIIVKDGKTKIMSVGNVFFYQDGKHRVLITPNTYHEKDGKKQVIITPGMRMEKDGKFRVMIPCHGTTTPPTNGGDTTAPVISSLNSSVSQTSATISWITNEAATGKVYYSTTSPVSVATASIKSSSLLQTGHSFSLTGLSASTTYYYFVESSDKKGNKATSTQQSFTTGNAADTSAPIITAVSVSNASSSSVTIGWTTNEAANSKVYYGTSTPLNLASASVKSDAGLVTAHSLGLTGLLPSTTYYFVVESSDGAGNTSKSSETSFATTVAPPVDTTAPIISAISVNNISTSSASVGWNTNEAADGKVYYGTATPLNLATAGSQANTSLLTSRTIGLSSLSPNTTYYYVVVSKDAAGNTATSSETSFTTNALPPADTTAPVISGVSAGSLASTTAAINWSTNEAATSKVYYGTTTPLNLGSALTVSNLSLVTNHSQGLSGLTASTTYYYVVESKDAANNTATSTESSFSTTN